MSAASHSTFAAQAPPPLASAVPGGACAGRWRTPGRSPGATSPTCATCRRSLIDVTIQPVMFVLLFVYVFGNAIHVPGGSYQDFLMAGIFVQSARVRQRGAPR